MLAGLRTRRAWTTNFVGAALVAAAAVLGVLLALIPATTVGGDGLVYTEMARHPFDTGTIGGPYPFRILGPLIVWALPLPIGIGFHLMSVFGLLLGAVATALLARRLGVPDLLAVLAAPAYLASFAGIYNVHQYRMIDAFSAGLISMALLAAWDRRALAFAAIAVLSTLAKEMGVLLPVAWAAAERSSWRRNWRAVITTALLAFAVVVSFSLIHRLVPHPVFNSSKFWTGYLEQQAHYGYAKLFGRALVQGFGFLWLLWPLGLLLASARWRWLHVYALLVVAAIVGGDWNRLSIFLLPIAIPSALLVLAKTTQKRAVAALAVSAFAAIILSLHNLNIGNERSGLATLAPALLVFLALSSNAVRTTIASTDFPMRRRRLRTRG